MESSYAIIPNMMLQIGDQFDRFQIQGHLAQGGMSEIYRAYDLVNRREVVLKLPDSSMIGDPAQYECFQREMEVVRTLDHPAILRCLDAGRFNRTPFLVTEFVLALDELEKDEVIRRALGPHLVDRLVSAKRQEWDEYRMEVTNWELEKYLFKY